MSTTTTTTSPQGATFSTLFKHGDTIYFMAENVPVHGIVRRIEIDSTEIIEIVDNVNVSTITTNVSYYCNEYASKIEEGRAFASRSDLIDSLP